MKVKYLMCAALMVGCCNSVDYPCSYECGTQALSKTLAEYRAWYEMCPQTVQLHNEFKRFPAPPQLMEEK